MKNFHIKLAPGGGGQRGGGRQGDQEAHCIQNPLFVNPSLGSVIEDG